MTYANATEMLDQRGSVTDAMYRREQRHSRTIRLLRRALPGLAILILVALVAKSVIFSLVGVSVDFAGTTIEGGKLIMANPAMGGFTASNRPYELTAERAIQDISNTESVDLEGIAARLPVGNSDWAQVDAATGTLYKGAGKLVITSPAVIKTTDGIHARMQSAVLHMATGDIHGNDSVEIDSDGSNVTAKSLTVTGGGDLMIFEGNVKVVLQPKRLATASATDEVVNATE